MYRISKVSSVQLAYNLKIANPLNMIQTVSTLPTLMNKKRKRIQTLLQI